MTFHAADCASLVILTSHPPQYPACDCPLSRGLPAQIPGGAAVAMSIRLDGLAKISGRAPVTAPSNVVSLVPNKCIAPEHDQIADRLMELASRIRAGEWPTMTHGVMILSDTCRVHTPWVYGPPITSGALVGLLEFVKMAVIEETRL